MEIEGLDKKMEEPPPAESLMTKAADGNQGGNENREIIPAPSIFEVVTRKPVRWFFLFVFPVIWAVFIGVGFSTEDKIETRVSELWVRQRSLEAENLDYAERVGRDSFASTSFAAMAIARDGENLFTKDRLDEIRARMELTESTTIEYNGETYTWDDICALNNAGEGTTYKFPCARLSPLDYFQEARWYFQDEDRVTWYRNIARNLLVNPRVPRFGIMQNSCTPLTGGTRNECTQLLLKRTFEGDPLVLFADIGNLEMNDPCKMCIETEFENTIDEIHAASLQVFQGLLAFAGVTQQSELVQVYTNILNSLDRQAALDFYFYYVTRSLYALLGEPDYRKSRDSFNIAISGCEIEGSTTPCPPPTTNAEATLALLNHADHAFSSTVTAGNPMPAWGDDGEGYLFEGDSPVGGSGIRMDGKLFSSAEFFALENATAADFESLVLTDPVHVWFMASQTPMSAHCGNGFLKGTNGQGNLDAITAAIMQNATQQWCTKYNEPFEEDGTRTVQFFARMWYDLLIDSPQFLDIHQGESDPYTWTTGQGCGYEIGGERYSYRDSFSQAELLGNVSGELYFMDEGEVLGAVDRNLLIGGTNPRDYNTSFPLEEASVIQSIYPALVAEDIVDRVRNCNRPQGPVDITVSDAEQILALFKEAFEENWSKDWDNNLAGEVSFVGFFDESGGADGTTGRMLEEVTASNGTLVVVSILIIAAFSVLFVIDCDLVESRILVTLLGVGLVILAFFAAVGFGLMVGIKINVTTAWTLPFIMLGLGVDDMYIVLLALRNQEGYTMNHFLAAMKEVVIPISMTSVVNASMFAILNLNDIPAVYLTAQIALLSVVFLYLTVVFCFSVWCYLDLCRQAEGKRDLLCCGKPNVPDREKKQKMWASVFYDKCYKPLVLEGSPIVIIASHLVIWSIAFSLVGLGAWGLTDENREVGLGLEDFFPVDHQGNRWASMRTEELASWSIQMNWGEVDYLDPEKQMRVIKQFENVVSSTNVAEVDTRFLWLADFAIWTTHQCKANFDRQDPNVLECGIDQVYPVDNSTCNGSWVNNTLELREKIFADDDTCSAFQEGICRPTTQMHPSDIGTIEGDIDIEAEGSWCPVLKDWDAGKLQFCLGRWRELNGGGRGRLVLENATGTPRTECAGEFKNDETVIVPIPYAAGPSMFAIDLFSHQITVDVIEETRSYCDYDTEVHCWLTGIPYDYWSQYVGIYDAFWEISLISVAAGFIVSFIFLMMTLLRDNRHSTGKIVIGSLIGALLIAITCVFSLVCVSGLSSLFDVSFTAFSTMSYVLSVGFAVEYSVHVVARWLLADSSLTTSLMRVEYAMEFLFLPTFMSFVSSTIGVACLAFTEFDFNEVFFFRPLIIVMLTTYFFGCWWLPCLLTLIDFDQVKFGAPEQEVKVLNSEDSEEEVAESSEVEEANY